MDFALTDEQRRWQQLARRFAYEEVRPRARELDRSATPREAFAVDLVRRASELGLRTIKIPTEYGGAGVDALTEIVVMEELAVGDCGFAMTLAHPWREGYLMATCTTPEQRDQFLPAFMRDPTYLTSMALSENHAGSDHGLPFAQDPQAGMRTFAELRGDQWVINGRKRWITSGNVSRMIVLWARTTEGVPWTEGVSLFLVPADAPGLRIARTEDKVGLRLNQNVELVFEDCRIPRGNLLGEVDRGHQLYEAVAHASKVKEAARALGVVRSAYELAAAWAHERVQGGRRIIEHESIATTLAEMATEIELARTLIWRAAWAVDHDRARHRPLEDMAMLYTSEMGMRVTAGCLRLFGARGSLRTWPMEKLLRDAATIMLPPFGNEAARVRLGRWLARHGEPLALMGSPNGGPPEPMRFDWPEQTTEPALAGALQDAS